MPYRLEHGILWAGLLILGLLVAAPGAYGGGLWIRDFGTVAQGRANAGEAAGVESAGTVGHNPAGLALLEHNEFTASGFALVGDAEFDINRTTPAAGTDDGGDIGETAAAGGLAYSHKLNDRWTLGFGVAGLTGAALDYNDDWVGRFQAQKVELLGIAAIPAIAWQATDKLSLGLSLPILYTDLDLEVAIPNAVDPISGPEGKAEVDADDTNVGVQLGAIYQFNERTRLGVMYLSEYEQEFSGGVDLLLPIGSAAVGVNAEINFAQLLRVGLAHNINDHYTLYLGAGWEDWSAFEDIIISTDAGGGVIPANWDDTWHVDAGIRYQPNDRWEYQAGFAYDSDPIDNSDRRADLPIDRQIRLSTGVSYTQSKRWRFGGYLTYIDLGSANLESSQFFGGEYDPNRIFMVGANLQFFPGR